MQTITAKLTPSQKKKERRDACYKLSTEMTSCVKDGLRHVSEEELESLIAGYMSLMQTPETEEGKEPDTEITLPVESLQQMALFAVQCIARQLLERQKS